MRSKSDKNIYWWLMSGVLLISLMVLIGGITRLTQSGLSIVEWKPIIGAIPPLNEHEWTIEFEKYKTSPEYRVYHSHFELSDFKAIFFWEYLHRLIGRVIGLVFFIPAVIFWVKKKFDRSLKVKVIIICLMGGFQGFMGWFMVKSGLSDNPHVSHYRLAAHLSTALILIGYIFLVARSIRSTEEKLTIEKGEKRRVLFIGLLISLQIIYGAFVAGLKAGKMYTTFPKMGQTWLPQELGYAWDMQGLLMLTESPVWVQLIHRSIGMLCVGFIIFTWIELRRAPRWIGHTAVWDKLAIIIVVQVILGISTLVLAVPVWLGVVHQAVAILVLLAYLSIFNTIKWQKN